MKKDVPVSTGQKVKAYSDWISRQGNAHLNSEGGSISMFDLLVLTGLDKVVLKMKKMLSLS